MTTFAPLLLAMGCAPGTPGDTPAPPTDSAPVDDSAVEDPPDDPVVEGVGRARWGPRLPPDRDHDGSPDDVDCAPDDPTIHPGADETCDGVDQDCDGHVDELPVDGTMFYWDDDGDGWGTTAIGEGCAPAGTAYVTGDCNDYDPDIHPGATETCDDRGTDHDCDDLDAAEDPDTVDLDTCWPDRDRDGQGDVGVAGAPCCDPPAGYVDNDLDCDDADRSVYTDDAWPDADDDGFGTGAAVQLCRLDGDHAWIPGDCDDADPDAWPGADELCGDGIDQDCDGSANEEDADADGARACEDCDDRDAAVHVGADEHCDGLDGDCDGVVDDGAVDTRIFFVDVDGDGWGGLIPVLACDGTDGLTALPGDCNDADAAISPGATETCRTRADDDCDGVANGLDSEGCRAAWADVDGDGFGNEPAMFCACPGDAAVAWQTGDCDDDDPEVHVTAPEDCASGKDEDCDGFFDCAEPRLVPLSWGPGPGSGYAGVFRFGTAGDGLFWAAEPGGSGVWPVLEPLGAGRVSEPETDPATLGSAAASWDLAVGDLTGDGHDDVVQGFPDAGSADPGAVVVFIGPPPGGIETWSWEIRWDGLRHSASAGAALGGIADMTGDGIPDVAMGVPDPTNGGEICFGSGDTTGEVRIADTPCHADARAIQSTRTGYSFRGDVDLDGDGQVDLFIDRAGSRTSPQAFLVTLGPIAADVTATAADIGGDAGCLPETPVKLGLLDDLGGDGLADVWLATPSAVYLYADADAAASCADVALTVPVESVDEDLRLVAADLDGDAVVDLAYAQRRTDPADVSLGLWQGPLAWGGTESAADRAFHDSDGTTGLGLDLRLGSDWDGDDAPDLHVSAAGVDLIPDFGGFVLVLPSTRLW